MRAHHPHWEETRTSAHMDWLPQRGSGAFEGWRPCGRFRTQSRSPRRHDQSPWRRPSRDSPLCSAPLQLTSIRFKPFGPQDGAELLASISADKACIGHAHRLYIPMLLEQLESIVPGADGVGVDAHDTESPPCTSTSCARAGKCGISESQRAYGRHGYATANERIAERRGFKSKPKRQRLSQPFLPLRGAALQISQHSQVTHSPFTPLDGAGLLSPSARSPRSPPYRESSLASNVDNGDDDEHAHEAMRFQASTGARTGISSKHTCSRPLSASSKPAGRPSFTGLVPHTYLALPRALFYKFHPPHPITAATVSYSIV